MEEAVEKVHPLAAVFFLFYLILTLAVSNIALSIIIDMRRYLVMEQSAAPMALNSMMSNIENNGAPWQYSQQDRLNWKNE
jgi:hypothetical protein